MSGDDLDNEFDNFTLDSSLQDEQFHRGLEEAERSQEAYELARAEAKAFDEFVGGLDATEQILDQHCADASQHWHEEIHHQPYDYGGHNNEMNYEQAADGFFVGAVGFAHLCQQAGRAMHGSGNEASDADTITPEDIDAQNEVLEEALANDLQQFAIDSEQSDFGAYVEDYTSDPWGGVDDYGHDSCLDESFDDGCEWDTACDDGDDDN